MGQMETLQYDLYYVNSFGLIGIFQILCDSLCLHEWKAVSLSFWTTSPLLDYDDREFEFAV